MSRAHVLALVCALGLPLSAYAIRPVRPVTPANPPDAGAPAATVPTTPPTPAEPEHAGPVRPAGQPAKPAAPAKPAIPPELLAKPPPPPKKIVNPAEVTYRQKTSDHLYALRVRPGEPKPGQTVELLLDLAKLHDPPDPVVGDREPEAGADLVVIVSKDGSGPQHALHAMEEPGQYGAHVSVAEAGLYTVHIVSRSKEGVEARFPLGIGVATPVRPDDVAATLVPASVGPTRAVRSRKQIAKDALHPALPKIMRELGEQFLALDAAIANHGDAAAHAHAMAELSKAIAGQTPPQNSERPQEFDQAANQLTGALNLLAQNPTHARLLDVEQNHCLKCHAEFRWGVASDVSTWPHFTAAEPKEEK